MYLTKFFVDGKPAAKQSFRYTRSGKKYQRANVKAWQDIVAIRSKQNWGKELTNKKLEVYLRFYLKKDLADVDNLSKAVLDGMQGIIYENDKQVKILHAQKVKAGNHEAGVYVEIKEIKNE